MSESKKPGVLPHGPIEKLEENLWKVEGALPNMPLKRVMTIVRLSGGQLLVHNPIALSGEALRQLEELGAPAYLIVPNGWHRLDSRWFVARYPAVRVYAPAGSRKKVEEQVPVAGILDEFPRDEAVVALADVDGTAAREGVMTARSSRGVTVVFADAVFNMPHLTGAQGFVLRHITQSSGGPRTSRIARLMLIKDKRAFAAHLERLAALPLVRIIVAHHLPITERPSEVLREVARTLVS